MYVYGRLGSQLFLFGISTSVYPARRMVIDAIGAGFTDVFMSDISHRYAALRQR